MGTPQRQETLPSVSCTQLDAIAPAPTMPTPDKRRSPTPSRCESPGLRKRSTPQRLHTVGEADAGATCGDSGDQSPESLAVLALINDGSVEDLKKIKGVRPKSAALIAAYRLSRGPFNSVDE